MVATNLSYAGPPFNRCSYSSVNFDDDYNRGCGKCRHNCNKICKGRLKRITILTLKVVIIINLALFVVFPLIFKFSYTLQRRAVFLNFGPIALKVAAFVRNFNLPKNRDYSEPSVFGLEGARNFYLKHDNVKLGVWQVLPLELSSGKTENISFESVLGNGQDIILYNHGNAGTRATGHCVELYKLLRRFFHVIVYDYRGYADSSDDPPSEQDVVSDSVFMVDWIRSKKAPEAHVFIWGHSLGSSITLGTVSALKKKKFVPTGIILEAPFNNMKEEITVFPLTVLFRHLPWFNFCIVDPITENGFTFKSDRYILDVDCPILILHAEDDRTVPFKLGKKLFEIGKENRLESQGTIQFEKFPESCNYGHKNIWKAPELPEIVEKFIRSAINESNSLQLGENF